jgi:hypothetical protein
MEECRKEDESWWSVCSQVLQVAGLTKKEYGVDKWVLLAVEKQ